MPDKKYDFVKILKEYNEKHEQEYKLDSAVSNPVIVCCKENEHFRVSFKRDDGYSLSRTLSLSDFIFHHISKSLSPSDIKSFILRKENDKLNLEIKILPPNKIRYAYLHSNYAMDGIGNLGKSCMRVKDMQKALNFYIKNNVRVVVVVDNNNKIHARALLWDSINSTKLKNPFTYLDRVYARSDTLLPLFSDLAKENKWKQYPSTSVNAMDKNYYIKNIDIAGMCFLPFMYTFRYLYPKDNILASSNKKSDITKYHECTTLNQHTNSGYYPSLDPDRVREALTGNFISKKDAIFVKRYDAWVLKRNIANIGGDYYSTHDSEVVKSKIDGFILAENSVNEVFTNEVIDKTKAISLTKYNGHVHKTNIVSVKGEQYHSQDTDIICFNCKWYHISQCFRNYNREEANKELAQQPPFCTGLRNNYILRASITAEGNLIPKKHAIIMYNLVYNPILDKIEYQKVYCLNKLVSVQLITGELIINSAQNKKYLKKFNNKWYIRKTFELSDEVTITLPDTEQTFKMPDKKQLLLFK